MARLRGIRVFGSLHHGNGLDSNPTQSLYFTQTSRRKPVGAPFAETVLAVSCLARPFIPTRIHEFDRTGLSPRRPIFKPPSES